MSCSQKTGLNYKMSGRQITISVPEQAPAIKQVRGFKIVGNVTDEKGEPLIGVSIFMKKRLYGECDNRYEWCI